jgi:DNA (cytosine-5)-methyltransferase 1
MRVAGEVHGVVALQNLAKQVRVALGGFIQTAEFTLEGAGTAKLRRAVLQETFAYMDTRMTSGSNELCFVDLFAGAGGFGLGFRQAGYRPVLSVEIDAWAAETMRQNDTALRVLQADIREYRDHATIRQLCAENVDVVIGGPPCQGFSIAGPATKDPSDPRNSLFREFANWVEALQPSAFILENVKGLVSRRTSDGLSVMRIIQQTFRALGYAVEVWQLNAANYGVPQMRERVFVVGNRIGCPLLGPPKASHTNAPPASGESGQLALIAATGLHRAVTLWQAISDLPPREPGQGEEEDQYVGPPVTDYQKQLRGRAQQLFNHVAMSHSRRLVERFAHVAWGQSSANVPSEHMARRRDGTGRLADTMYSQNNRRLHPERPSHTIAASFYANFLHPYQHRNLTAREGARVQSFPDAYRFFGKKTVVSQKLLHREERHDEKFLCQYAQIGNAVPPLLARRIAEHLAQVLSQ